MKRISIPLALIVCCMALGQKPWTFKDGNISLEAIGASWTAQGQDYNFDLRGSAQRQVVLTSASQGLRLTAPRMTARTSPERSITNQQTLRSAKLTGGVRAIKTTTEGGASRTTEVTSQTADYTASSSESRLVLQGGVRLVDKDTRQRQTLVATGASGTVILAPTRVGGGLRTATLTQNVRVEVVQVDPAGQRKTLVATGNRLVVNQNAKPTTVTLTGNVRITGGTLGASEGIRELVMSLNEQGEVTRLRASS